MARPRQWSLRTQCTSPRWKAKAHPHEELGGCPAAVVHLIETGWLDGRADDPALRDKASARCHCGSAARDKELAEAVAKRQNRSSTPPDVPRLRHSTRPISLQPLRHVTPTAIQATKDTMEGPTLPSKHDSPDGTRRSCVLHDVLLSTSGKAERSCLLKSLVWRAPSCMKHSVIGDHGT